MDLDALFDGFNAAWTSRDAARFESVCVDDVHYEDPLTPAPLVGIAKLATHAAELWSAFPDVQVSATGARIADGAFACAPCRIAGTHRGQIGRISPTRKRVEVHAVVYAELRDGMLWRVRAFFDVYGAGTQIGALPKHGTAGERALLMLRGFGLRG
jgi:steroid delta-isomerase-like uncharacterized protein